MLKLFRRHSEIPRNEELRIFVASIQNEELRIQVPIFHNFFVLKPKNWQEN